MFTSNVQLGYLLTRGGGQAVQGGLSCPPPRISERMDNLQILLHHLLQEYLVERDINFTEMLTSNVQLGCVLTRGGGKLSRAVCLAPRPEFQRERIISKFERDINFISVNLRCLLQMFSWVTYWQEVGGKLSRAVYLVPSQNFRENG